MNVRLLRKIQKHILAEPRRFSMLAWLQRPITAKTRVHDSRLTFAFPKCNTAACIAGWAVLLTSPDPERITSSDISWSASRVLEIGDPESDIGAPLKHPLFYTKDWPRRFRVAYNKSRTPRKRAKVAAARIDHFIKTKGRE